MKRTLLVLLLLFFIALINQDLKAQCETDSAEINWRVKELIDFHDIIHPMWHDAYPNKDIAALQTFVPEIKSHIEKINNVTLPGILQDKVGKWQENLKNLNETAEKYYAAAEEPDEQALLDAAEELHSRFEIMVRTIAPVMKEVDLYHQLLYVIIHKMTPNKDYAAISGVIDELIIRAENIKTAKISKRVEDKAEEFAKATDKLIETTKALKDLLNSDDNAKKDAAIDAMHNSYMDMEHLFD